MMPILRLFFKLVTRSGLLAVAWIAGCHMPGGQLDYGVQTPPHDPTVELIDFSYTPASPIHVGDTLTFSAKLNHHSEAADLVVRLGEPPVEMAALRDDGSPPDLKANDGVYAGKLVWTPELGPAADLLITFQLLWFDGPPYIERTAPPLTVKE